jgi:glycosyltransferase involved in cell wall biosynthesis
MRIAIVHSFYSSAVPSGENAIVLEQVDALTAGGHEVVLVARHTDDDIHQIMYFLRSAGRVITGRGPDPTDELRDFAPDIVHVHNLFPNFGTRWLRSWPGPIVATLHNFRPICANGLLFRDGHYCEDCPSGSKLAAVRHACYHQSRVASVPLAIRNARGLEHNELVSRADTLICLSEAAAAIYRRFGGATLPIVVVPNGVYVPRSAEPGAGNDRWIAIARLTPEKGVRQLVEVWPPDQRLDIVGDGPEADLIRGIAPACVNLVGRRDRNELLATLPQYLGLLFPSRCLEMQPTVLIEALASGLPIVAFGNNAGAELVRATGAGSVATSTDLRDALVQAVRGRTSMAEAGVAAYKEAFSTARWAARLVEVYQGAGASGGVG